MIFEMKEKETELWTDNPEYVRLYMENPGDMQPFNVRAVRDTDLNPFLFEAFEGKPLFFGRVKVPGWKAALILKRAPQSHFDLLVKHTRSRKNIPAPLFMLSGSSAHCHGQRGRPWKAVEGNLHMAVLLTPRRSITGFGPGILSLAAVSVVETLDAVAGLKGKAGIKWVNDILLGGAKVAGFLVHTQSTGDRIHSIVIGLGINVEKTPAVPADPFVPRIVSLKDISSRKSPSTRKDILSLLLDRILRNYMILLEKGPAPLVDLYRRRSVVVGRRVDIVSDPLHTEDPVDIVASGVVERIGDHLELFLKDLEPPVSRGRLILRDSL